MIEFPIRPGGRANIARVAAIGLLAGSLLAAAQCAYCAAMRAASAKADITPSDHVELWGYSDRKGPATGTRDPLYGKVLLLDDGKRRLAIVTLDLGRPFGLDSMNFVRERVEKSAKVDQVFFCASHTHSGPVILDAYPAGDRPAWETAALDKIAAAIEQAAARLQPARLGTGEGATYIGHNRRFVRPDGSVKMLWRNATKIATHPLDPRVGVLRVDGEDGKVLAVLVNYACHPVVFGQDHLRYSADYPSAMADVVEHAFGEPTVCLFLQGAAGDINPYFDKTPLAEDAEDLMKQTGRQLGEEALRVARSIVPQAPAKPELKYHLETRRFRPRYDPEKLADVIRRTVPAQVRDRYIAYLKVPLDCTVTTLLINREIAFMGLPGEPFVEFGLDFRDRAPAKMSFFAGYTNGYYGYFPTIRAATQGGYGAEGLVSRVEVGAGETMVDMAVIQLDKMAGLLKPFPAAQR